MPYSEDQLRHIYDKMSGTCRYCLKKLAWKNYGKVGARGAWEVDHSNPKVRGGSDYLRNLWPACISCNRAKGDKTLQRFAGEVVFRDPRVIDRLERLEREAKGRRRKRRKSAFGLQVADAASRLSQPDGIPVFGAYVGGVKPGSSAEKAGLRLGDVIVQVNRSFIASAQDLARVLRTTARGSKLTIAVLRDHKTLVVEARR